MARNPRKVKCSFNIFRLRLLLDRAYQRHTPAGLIAKLAIIQTSFAMLYERIARNPILLRHCEMIAGGPSSPTSVPPELREELNRKECHRLREMLYLEPWFARLSDAQLSELIYQSSALGERGDGYLPGRSRDDCTTKTRRHKGCAVEVGEPCQGAPAPTPAAPLSQRVQGRTEMMCVRSVFLRHNASDVGLRSPASACGSGGARVRACETFSSHETFHRAYVLSALKPHGVGGSGGGGCGACIQLHDADWYTINDFLTKEGFAYRFAVTVTQRAA